MGKTKIQWTDALAIGAKSKGAPCCQSCGKLFSKESVANGTKVKLKRKAGVFFDEDQFAEIRQRAVKEKTSFSYQVRLLVEWGLEA